MLYHGVTLPEAESCCEPDEASPLRCGRSRSEYRSEGPWSVVAVPPGLRRVTVDDRMAIASLFLDAYRGTIDDEGEGFDDALAAATDCLECIRREHSFVLETRSVPTAGFDPVQSTSAGSPLIAMAFVVVVEGHYYIDPVATAAAFKGRGLGVAMVSACLRSLAAAGIEEVRAAITDGNTPSERLFARLGFRRVGAWV